MKNLTGGYYYVLRPPLSKSYDYANSKPCHFVRNVLSAQMCQYVCDSSFSTNRSNGKTLQTNASWKKFGSQFCCRKNGQKVNLLSPYATSVIKYKNSSFVQTFCYIIIV